MDEIEDQPTSSIEDNIQKNIDDFTENGSGWVFLKNI